MFIKSQCRKVLVDVDCFEIDKDNYILAYKDNKIIVLGEYKSDKRALEVLDMMCDAIEDGMEFIEDDSKVSQSIIRKCIFEMPII